MRDIRDRLEKAKTHWEKDHRDMVEAKGLAQLILAFVVCPIRPLTVKAIAPLRPS